MIFSDSVMCSKEATESFDESMISSLEKILKKEESWAINLDLYVKILTLYQFYPSSASYSTICLIAMKTCLLGMRKNAFTACCCIIPEKLFENKELREIMRLHELIEKMAIAEIWLNVQSYIGLAISIGWTNANIEQIIRKNIVDIACVTFMSIPVSQFLKIMNYKDIDVMSKDEFVAEKKYTIDNGIVTFEKGLASERTELRSIPTTEEVIRAISKYR